jgi:hypothetical protein
MTNWFTQLLKKNPIAWNWWKILSMVDILLCDKNVLNRNVSIMHSKDSVQIFCNTKDITRTGFLHNLMASGMDTPFVQVSHSISTYAQCIRMAMAIKPMRLSDEIWIRKIGSKFQQSYELWESCKTHHCYTLVQMYQMLHSLTFNLEIILSSMYWK